MHKMGPMGNKTKKGVTALVVSVGGKGGMPPMPDKMSSDYSESESDEGDSLDTEETIIDDLDSALKSKDASKLYDAICATIAHKENEKDSE